MEIALCQPCMEIIDGTTNKRHDVLARDGFVQTVGHHGSRGDERRYKCNTCGTRFVGDNCGTWLAADDIAQFTNLTLASFSFYATIQSKSHLFTEATMATTQYFEEKFYPPNAHGRADKTDDGTVIQLMVTSFYGDHQIFLRINEGMENEQELHLTKIQARDLAEALNAADQTIGYDNTAPIPADD